MKINNLYFFILLALVFSRCANIVTPTGGEKDLTPPVPVSYSPDTNSLYFDATEIHIQFDEYITMNDIFNQVIISPPLNGIPEYKLKGKTLTIKLNSELRDSTTYTINFGEAIKDNTEGNILDNFTYVFSTGSYLDSLEISGTVTDLLTGAPLEKTFVELYYEPNDTSFFTSAPYYFAKTDKSGKFKISNIKAGRYKLYALEDQNFNYFYDLPNERIAFKTEKIQIDSNIYDQKLQLFSEEKIAQNLLETKSQRYAQLRLIFAKPATDVIITSLNTQAENIYFTRNKMNDTINVWTSNYQLDTFKLNIKYDTSDINRSVYLKSIPPDSNFNLNINTFTTNVVVANKGEDARGDWDPEKNIILNFNNPIAAFDTTYFQIWNVTDSTAATGDIIQIDSLDARKLYIQYNWKPEVSYDIRIGKYFTKDIFGLNTKNDTVRIRLRKADAYSVLTTTIVNTSGNNILLQLLRSDLSQVKDFYLPNSYFTNADSSYVIAIKNLPPGTYKLRAIIDADKNKKWSPGDIEKNILPETVLIFPVEQNLRANWENEITWEIK